MTAGDKPRLSEGTQCSEAGPCLRGPHCLPDGGAQRNLSVWGVGSGQKGGGGTEGVSAPLQAKNSRSSALSSLQALHGPSSGKTSHGFLSWSNYSFTKNACADGQVPTKPCQGLFRADPAAWHNKPLLL